MVAQSFHTGSPLTEGTRPSVQPVCVGQWWRTPSGALVSAVRRNFFFKYVKVLLESVKPFEGAM